HYLRSSAQLEARAQPWKNSFLPQALAESNLRVRQGQVGQSHCRVPREIGRKRSSLPLPPAPQRFGVPAPVCGGSAEDSEASARARARAVRRREPARSLALRRTPV